MSSGAGFQKRPQKYFVKNKMISAISSNSEVYSYTFLLTRFRITWLLIRVCLSHLCILISGILSVTHIKPAYVNSTNTFNASKVTNKL